MTHYMLIVTYVLHKILFRLFDQINQIDHFNHINIDGMAVVYTLSNLDNIFKLCRWYAGVKRLRTADLKL